MNRKELRIRILVILLSGAYLSGCSSIGHEEFDCPNNPNGYGCKGLKEVHELITEKSGGQVITPIVSQVSSKNVDPKMVSSSENSLVQRTQEESLRVWIAPFQDEQGNFHEPSVIHTVIRPSYWQANTINWE